MNDVSTPSRGIGTIVDKVKRRLVDGDGDNSNLIKDSSFFKRIKPRQGYTFKSDYFTVDGTHATVLTIMHDQGADDHLGYFWGVHLIPRQLGANVSVRRLEHVGRVSESWVESHQGRAEGLLNNQMGEHSRGDSSMIAQHRLSKRQQQLVDIANDLMNGASYLRVALRLLVKAPTLEELDDAVNKINRQYKDRFDTLFAAPYVGEQKRELSNLLNKVEDKQGRNFMFTSSEFAGNYSLVTRGIEDRNGEYIGRMRGDVNNSAILMDIDRYNNHVVIAGNAPARTLSVPDFGAVRGVDLWGMKLSSCALLRNRRVVHLVLNRAKVGAIGADLSDITANVDMTKGDINPFEMFGERKDSLNIFPAHVEKLTLMLEQLQPSEGNSASRIRNALSETLNDFYVDKRMWARDAQRNKSALRVVGIPHDQVPKLHEFVAYLNMEYEAQVKARNKDPEVMNAYGFLRGAFRNMMDTNGDLFNTITSDNIDKAAVSNRVVYNFSELIRRGRPLMMAQFVNALGYAVGQLGKGDVVILHGVDQLDPKIKRYVKDQFNQLNENGTRTVYIYSDIGNMIADRGFNQFESADYTLLGGMTRPMIEDYENALKQEVPVALKGLLEHKEKHVYYLRRGFDNIVFGSDIQMGFS